MRRTLAALAALATLSLWDAPRALAQSPDEFTTIRKEIEALRAGQADLQKELLEIKRLLLRARTAQEPPEPRDLVLSIEGAPVKGDAKAKLTLIDFSDYQ